MHKMVSQSPPRSILLVALGLAFASLTACGGGGSSAAGSSSSSSSSSSAAQVIASPGPNAAVAVVDCGPTSICDSNEPDVNLVFVTVTICEPASPQTCATIDHVQVDTASYGLRILAPALQLLAPAGFALPAEMSSLDNNALAECTEFADGYSWGPLATANVQIAQESAMNVPVQIIGDPNYTTVPADCVQSGGMQEDTVATFGANGIIGVGPFPQDCGGPCSSQALPSAYYECPTTSTCADSQVTLAQQVTNPVVLFSSGDSNGVIVELPQVPAGGATTATGVLVFGIGTQTNNAMTAKTIIPADPNTGVMSTTYNGTALTDSFIDSGSNGYFFASSITPCPGASSSFYCPASTLGLSATMTGAATNPLYTGAVYTIDFSIANASDLTGAALDDLGGTPPAQSASASTTFDWGLSFFFGRNVYTAIQGEATAVGEGPYFAF